MSLRINEGIVLAADSALSIDSYDGKTTDNVYFNTNKLFRLSNNLPIGLMAVGIGSIGRTPMRELILNLRSEIRKKGDRYVDPNNYTIDSVAKTALDYFYELYWQEFSLNANPPKFQIIVTGYDSIIKNIPQEFIVHMEGRDFQVIPNNKDARGIACYGMPDAVYRLINGYSAKLVDVLNETSVSNDDLEALMNLLRIKLYAPLFKQELPLRDAIDLAKFLVKTASKYARFMPIPPKVGGPTCIAVIPIHDRFRWIKRNRVIRK